MGNDGRRVEGKHEDAQRNRKTNSASLTRTGKHRMGMEVEDIHRQHACKATQNTAPHKTKRKHMIGRSRLADDRVARKHADEAPAADSPTLQQTL